MDDLLVQVIYKYYIDRVNYYLIKISTPTSNLPIIGENLI